MLIAKIYINREQIEEIHVRNMVNKNSKGETLYKIYHPEGYETVKIWHQRDLGYQTLLEKVLKII